MRYPHYSPEEMDAVCEVTGLEHLDAALSRGKGAIVLIGHLGANQMIMPALGHKGYAMNQLSAPPPVWADLLKDTRATPLWRKVLERRWELEKRLDASQVPSVSQAPSSRAASPGCPSTNPPTLEAALTADSWRSPCVRALA